MEKIKYGTNVSTNISTSCLPPIYKPSAYWPEPNVDNFPYSCMSKIHVVNFKIERHYHDGSKIVVEAPTGEECERLFRSVVGTNNHTIKLIVDENGLIKAEIEKDEDQDEGTV